MLCCLGYVDVDVWVRWVFLCLLGKKCMTVKEYLFDYWVISTAKACYPHAKILINNIFIGSLDVSIRSVYIYHAFHEDMRSEKERCLKIECIITAQALFYCAIVWYSELSI